MSNTGIQEDRPAAAASRRKRMEIFRGTIEPQHERDHLTVAPMDASVLAGFAKMQAAGASSGLGEQTARLFAEEDENGLSLVRAWFRSNYILPRHSHNADCLYYIIGGELQMGTVTLRKGDGVFIPCDHGYTFQAGPEGVDLLEFRAATRYNIVFKGNDEAYWDRIADNVRTHAAAWAEERVPPSER
jgi:mannose-6-phosphate isomerase-like protein (cupin superfamily)